MNRNTIAADARHRRAMIYRELTSPPASADRPTVPDKGDKPSPQPHAHYCFSRKAEGHHIITAMLSVRPGDVSTFPVAELHDADSSNPRLLIARPLELHAVEEIIAAIHATFPNAASPESLRIALALRSKVDLDRLKRIHIELLPADDEQDEPMPPAAAESPGPGRSPVT